MFYVIEISTNAAFAPMFASWVLHEQVGTQTVLQSPQTLPASTTFFWRVQAYDSTTAGPWSATQTFRTLTVATPPPGGPTPGPPGCPIPAATPYDTLVCARAGYPHPMNHGHRGALMNQVAWAHRGEGWGLHRKDSGNLCPQPRTGTSISCDILVHGPSGGVYDVLIDEEVPTWGYKGPINSMSNFVAPVQP
jgi:hypothetical protein